MARSPSQSVKPIHQSPSPTLPNTSEWTWYCCRCQHANRNAHETTHYSYCAGCGHERCLECNISWKSHPVKKDYAKRAADRHHAYCTGRINTEEYLSQKQEDEDEAEGEGSVEG